VIEKQAVVREEVVLAPRVQERVEQIHDTVRRMDADVERLEPASADQNGSIPK
jgi:stress response protein YsnF